MKKCSCSLSGEIEPQLLNFVIEAYLSMLTFRTPLYLKKAITKYVPQLLNQFERIQPGPAKCSSATFINKWCILFLNSVNSSARCCLQNERMRKNGTASYLTLYFVAASVIIKASQAPCDSTETSLSVCLSGACFSNRLRTPCAESRMVFLRMAYAVWSACATFEKRAPGL